MRPRRCPTCNKLIGKGDGPFSVPCPRCKVIVVFDGPSGDKVALPAK